MPPAERYSCLHWAFLRNVTIIHDGLRNVLVSSSLFSIGSQIYRSIAKWVRQAINQWSILFRLVLLNDFQHGRRTYRCSRESERFGCDVKHNCARIENAKNKSKFLYNPLADYRSSTLSLVRSIECLDLQRAPVGGRSGGGQTKSVGRALTMEFIVKTWVNKQRLVNQVAVVEDSIRWLEGHWPWSLLWKCAFLDICIFIGRG